MQKLKLNIGCGLTAPLEWVNIDSSLNARLAKYPWLRKLLAALHLVPLSRAGIAYPKNIYIYNIKKNLPFPGDSTEVIYCSHFLEHLSRQGAQSFIEECRRVLVKGGIIRVIVPDLAEYAKEYVEKITCDNHAGLEGRPPAEKFLEDLCIFEKEPADENILTRAYKKIYKKNTHKWMYDEYSLALLLERNGFSGIQRKQAYESLIKDIDKLENADRFNSAICLEALKR